MTGLRPSFENLQQHTAFISRHIGPDEREQQAMLAVLGLDSMDALIRRVIPVSYTHLDVYKRQHADVEHRSTDEITGDKPRPNHLRCCH